METLGMDLYASFLLFIHAEGPNHVTPFKILTWFVPGQIYIWFDGGNFFEYHVYFYNVAIMHVSMHWANERSEPVTFYGNKRAVEQRNIDDA